MKIKRSTINYYVLNFFIYLMLMLVMDALFIYTQKTSIFDEWYWVVPAFIMSLIVADIISDVIFARTNFKDDGDK